MPWSPELPWWLKSLQWARNIIFNITGK
jgi:hypothetical protein